MNEEMQKEMQKMTELAQILELFDRFQQMQDENLEVFKESVYALLRYNNEE